MSTIKLVQTVSELRKELEQWRDKTVGLVPTMGYLHQGHESLLKKAREESSCVVLSIFVNPLQFGANEDIDIYPRDIEQDIAVAKKSGVDIIFFPTENEIYLKKPLLEIHIPKITSSLCGASRPGHFEGVALVVTKLFNMVSPNRAYFGEKDAQQVAVIKQLVCDLSFHIDIVTCPTYREDDGLAMSSRNVYLTKAERKEATILSSALREVKELLKRGSFSTALEINQYVVRKIQEKPLAEIVYVETLTYPELEEVTELYSKKMIVAIAVRFGKTRLIDNLIF